MDSVLDGVLTVAQIMFVNVVLSGDNALVIALTAKQFPPELRRKAVLWGSASAVLLQVLFALIVGSLLEIPGLRLAGAMALVLIARKLVQESTSESTTSTREKSRLLGAVLAILVANLAMSFDNVVAVGALSRGSPLLLGTGILISAVILLSASSIVVVLIQRFSWITFVGAGLLGCTAAGMICEEPLLEPLHAAGEAVLTQQAGRNALEAEPAIAGVSETPARASMAPLPFGWLPQSWALIVYGGTLSVCLARRRVLWGAITRLREEGGFLRISRFGRRRCDAGTSPHAQPPEITTRSVSEAASKP